MDAARPNRKYHRLRDYDYASAGLYFVTLCTSRRKCFLSRVNGIEDEAILVLGLAGRIVEQELRLTEEKRPDVLLIDEVIMPNHVHLVIQLTGDASTGRRNEFKKPLPGTIGTIVGQIKSRVTTRLREHYKNANLEVWQGIFHDHVIRNEEKLRVIQQYVRDNPGKWIEDRYHPDNLAKLREQRAKHSGRRSASM